MRTHENSACKCIMRSSTKERNKPKTAHEPLFQIGSCVQFILKLTISCAQTNENVCSFQCSVVRCLDPPCKVMLNNNWMNGSANKTVHPTFGLNSSSFLPMATKMTCACCLFLRASPVPNECPSEQKSLCESQSSPAWQKKQLTSWIGQHLSLLMSNHTGSAVQEWNIVAKEQVLFCGRDGNIAVCQTFS